MRKVSIVALIKVAIRCRIIAIIALIAVVARILQTVHIRRLIQKLLLLLLKNHMLLMQRLLLQLTWSARMLTRTGEINATTIQRLDSASANVFQVCRVKFCRLSARKLHILIVVRLVLMLHVQVHEARPAKFAFGGRAFATARFNARFGELYGVQAERVIHT